MRAGIHTATYLARMRERTLEAKRRGKLIEAETSAGYTVLTEAAARVAAAALIDATLAVAARRFDNAFVLCRPPTHHAVGDAQCCRGESPPNAPFGFCHINGIGAAIAALWARAEEAGLPRQRVAIIDVDVHHGNANEDTFYECAEVHLNLIFVLWPYAILLVCEAAACGTTQCRCCTST